MLLKVLYKNQIPKYNQLFIRVFSKLKNDVVITSAVRTPITKNQGQLSQLSAVELGAIVVDAAVKQAAVSQNYVDEIYLSNIFSSNQEPARQVAIGANLSKHINCTTVNNAKASGLKAISLATKKLQSGHASVIIAGGMESISNVPKENTAPGGIKFNDVLAGDSKTDSPKILDDNLYYDYIKTTSERAEKAYLDGSYVEELIPIRVKHKHKKPILLEKDELVPELTSSVRKSLPTYGDGAAALVMTTALSASKLNIKPLARIIFCQEVFISIDSFPAVISKMLRHFKIKAESIAMWEIDDTFCMLPLTVINELNLDPAKVNRHGGTLILGNPIGMSGSRLVTHLTHALQPGQIGCAIIYNPNAESSILLLQKCANLSNETRTVPILTLYTKDPCPLCDVMVDKLEKNFPGSKYLLKKVDISLKDNERFLDLFKYDIPVLFLNGQFLCMHELNIELLKRKLKEISS